MKLVPGDIPVCQETPTADIGARGSEWPDSPDFVEKLFNFKIGSKIWNVVLAGSVLAHFIRDIGLSQDGVLQTCSSMLRHGVFQQNLRSADVGVSSIQCRLLRLVPNRGFHSRGCGGWRVHGFRLELFGQRLPKVRPKPTFNVCHSGVRHAGLKQTICMSNYISACCRRRSSECLFHRPAIRPTDGNFTSVLQDDNRCPISVPKGLYGSPSHPP